MLNLVTGVPGSGKTLYVITQLKDEKTRPIYYHAIENLHSSLDWHEITKEEARNWPENIPDGAILVIDEVQKIFGTRPPKELIPSGVSALELHRHRGIDIYFITQHATMLDHHARRLVNRHIHLNRPIGTPKYAIVYTSNESFDPSDARTLQQIEKTRFIYPKKNFSLYKSTEIDTHKTKLPKKLILIPLLILFLVFLSVVFFRVLYRAGTRAQTVNQTGYITNPHSQIASTSYPSNTFSSFPMPEPKPWDIQRTAACIISSDGTRCACYTQQGIYQPDIPTGKCMKFALFGEHDIYKSYRNPVEEPATNRNDKPTI
jgi:zona occludens toxin (predicted ATPase)